MPVSSYPHVFPRRQGATFERVRTRATPFDVSAEQCCRSPLLDSHTTVRTFGGGEVSWAASAEVKAESAISAAMEAVVRIDFIVRGLLDDSSSSPRSRDAVTTFDTFDSRRSRYGMHLR
jgi:hypothetical protein